jgi:hypothetical protein
VLRQTLQKSNQSNVCGYLCLAFIAFSFYHFLKDCIASFPEAVTCVAGQHPNTLIHLLTVGLIPIYIGLLIYGLTISSLYIGALFQAWFIRILS